MTQLKATDITSNFYLLFFYLFAHLISSSSSTITGDWLFFQSSRNDSTELYSLILKVLCVYNNLLMFIDIKFREFMPGFLVSYKSDRRK